MQSWTIIYTLLVLKVNNPNSDYNKWQLVRNDIMLYFTIIEIIHQSNENGWNNNLNNLKRNKVPS